MRHSWHGLRWLRGSAASIRAIALTGIIGATALPFASAQTAVSPADAPGGTAAILPSLSAPVIDSPGIPNGPWARREITVTSLAATETAPNIDGRLDESCWHHALHAQGFFRSSGTSPVAEQTEAWVLCDRKYLYVAFHCLDSHPSLIRESETQRNGDIDGDDHVGIDIDSQNIHKGLSSFRVTSRGTQSESIEGGTADNITWVGDWHAAAQRTKDGWTCEMAIPFRLLHYPRGSKAFGLMLYRRLARETSREVWPFLPREGEQDEAQYLHSFTGLNPPTIAPRPVFLPYLLTSAGDASAGGTHAREGIDIKYPLTTTMTGVATLFPDFQTIEQQVTDISFSYTEKYLPDRRPFFAEGSDFLPYRDQFYSRRVGEIDGGFKVVGKEDKTSVGFLGTTSGWGKNDPAKRQQVYLAQVRREIGQYAFVSANVLENHQAIDGYATNRTTKFEAGWSAPAPGRYRPNATVNIAPSWQGGQRKGAKEFLHLGAGAPGGHPNVGINWSSVPDDFVSDLGFNPDLNQRGFNAWLEQYNDFDRGAIQSYWTGFNFGRKQKVHPNTFFSDYANPEFYVELRRGLAFDVGYNQSRREQFRDHTTDYDFSWGRRTLYQRGGIHLTAGRVADEAYRYIGINQSLLLARPLTLRAEQSWVTQGVTRQTQTIVTGTYRLSDSRAFGTRLVHQSGHGDPSAGSDTPNGTNLYVSYAQHVRAGYDLFVLVGDPNSVKTRGTATVKIIQPF